MGTNQSSEQAQPAIYSNSKTDYKSSNESVNSHRGYYIIGSSGDEANVTDSERCTCTCAQCRLRRPRRPSGPASLLPVNNKSNLKLKSYIEANEKNSNQSFQNLRIQINDEREGTFNPTSQNQFVPISPNRSQFRSKGTKHQNSNEDFHRRNRNKKVHTPINYPNMQKEFNLLNGNEETKYAEDDQFAQRFNQVNLQQNQVSAEFGGQQPQNYNNFSFDRTVFGRFTNNAEETKGYLNRHKPKSKSWGPSRSKQNRENLHINSANRNSFRVCDSVQVSNFYSHQASYSNLSSTQKNYPESISHDNNFNEIVNEIKDIRNEINKINKKVNSIQNEKRLLYENRIKQQEIERLNKIIQEQKAKNEAFIKGQNDQNSRNVLIDGHENAGFIMTEIERNYEFIEVQDFDSEYSLREQNRKYDIFKSTSVSIYDGEIND